jgi:replicative DNA helicase
VSNPSAVVPPASIEAEKSVLGQIMAGGAVVAGEVIGSLLDAKHFYAPAHRMIFETIIDRYYVDDPIDPISIAEALGGKLTRAWNCTAEEAAARLADMARGVTGASVTDHAKLVKQEFDRRELLELAGRVQRLVGEGVMSPEEIGSLLSLEAMRISTDSLVAYETKSFADLGRDLINTTRRNNQLLAAGVELGAYFGLDFIDDWVVGLRPQELLFCAGPPGSGKSSVWWTAALRHAERQAKNPPGMRRGTLVISLEMGGEASAMRLAGTLTGIDTRIFRKGQVPESQLNPVIREWGRRKNIPLHFTFRSRLKASQIRALCVEAIRTEQVTTVIIDHFRYFDMDRTYNSSNEEDDAKVRFLKEDLAKDLNLAVVCIAHTVKSIESVDGRPEMKHLRGSGQIAADADFINFVHRPYLFASEAARTAGDVLETDAELLWEKNRHGDPGTAKFYFEPRTMTIRDLYPGGF